MSVDKNRLMEKRPCSSSSTEAYVSSLGGLGLGKSRPPPPPSSSPPRGGSEVGHEENSPPPLLHLNKCILLGKEKEKEKSAQEEEKESVVAEFGFGGVLHKWTNIGKGWRPRWFTLRHGVLSYYRVHKLSLRRQDLRGVTVVGEESKKLMKKQQQRRIPHHPNKLLGELHLQVSSIKKSESDDRRFYIYTGTKTLHLRAESREDRSTWLDALYAAKEHFPSPSSYMKDLPEFQISTKKLEAFLEKEGVSQDAIRECEAIIGEEFSIFQDHIRSLQQKQKFLVDRLRTLAAEKVELENTVMSARRRNEPCMNVSGAIEGGIETESDDEKRSQSGVDIETDDNDIFFDTSESLSRSGSMSQITSDEFAGDCIRPELKPATSAEHSNNVEITGFNYPNVQRRKRLPEPREIEKGVSLWSIIKDNIGKDLTRICLPVYFNEPLSSLQRCFEDLEYSNLLDRASEWGKKGNHLMRILNVAAFAVSGYSSTVGRTCKPFNPLLGETYEADYPDKGLHFFSEKVSHHPMIVACHCQGNGWVFWGDCNLKSRFWGHSIRLDPVGILTLHFDDGETFCWSKVTSSIHNIIIGKPYCHHSGTMKIQGNKGLSCKIQFKEHSIIERNPRQVQGFVNDRMGKKIATLFGKWDGSMYYMLGDISKKPRGFEPMSEAVLLWTCNDPPELPTRYNLTAFAITLNEFTPGLKEKLPLTDSRMRPDQRHLENGDFDQANAEKLKLEQKQREARKLQENGWKPLWFAQGKEGGQFEYIGGYWEARERGDWRRCSDIFGIGKQQEEGTISSSSYL